MRFTWLLLMISALIYQGQCFHLYSDGRGYVLQQNLTVANLNIVSSIHALQSWQQQHTNAYNIQSQQIAVTATQQSTTNAQLQQQITQLNSQVNTLIQQVQQLQLQLSNSQTKITALEVAAAVPRSVTRCVGSACCTVSSADGVQLCHGTITTSGEYGTHTFPTAFPAGSQVGCTATADTAGGWMGYAMIGGVGLNQVTVQSIGTNTYSGLTRPVRWICRGSF